MKTYLVGRSNQADIALTNADHSVSNFHLELTKDSDGKYYIIDRNSTNGTFHQRNGRKCSIRQTYVDFDEPLILGKYQTTVRQLLSQLQTTKQPETFNGGPKERNPENGEIIFRRQ